MAYAAARTGFGPVHWPNIKFGLPVEALQAINLKSGPIQPVRAIAHEMEDETVEELISCDYFQLRRRSIRESVLLGGDLRFRILIGTAGDSLVQHGKMDYRLPFGSTLLLPAAIGACEIMPAGDSAQILECFVP